MARLDRVKLGWPSGRATLMWGVLALAGWGSGLRWPVTVGLAGAALFWLWRRRVGDWKPGEAGPGLRRLAGARQRTVPPASPGGQAQGARTVAVAGRLKSLACVFDELARSLHEVTAAREGLAVQEELGLQVHRLASMACRGCERHTSCWEDAFVERYHMAVDILSAATGEEPPEPDAAWQAVCLRPREVAAAAGHLAHLQVVERRWQERLHEHRALLAGHMRGLSGALEVLAEEAVAGPAPLRRRRPGPRLGYATEVAKEARDGRLVSGDSHLIRELPGECLLLALSDGMGAGDRAALESRAALSLLERLLVAGYDRHAAVRLVNAVLVLRSPEENFATLDMVLVDLRAGEAECIKVGAAASFAKRGDQVTAVRAHSLPLGILDDVEPQVACLTVRPGDALVMVTDGALEGPGDLASREEWLRSHLACGGANRPGLARSVLEAARGLGRSDDTTVLAVRFYAPGAP